MGVNFSTQTKKVTYGHLRQIILPLARLALTLAAGIWIVRWLYNSGSNFQLPVSFHWGYALLALALVPVGLLLRAYKWKMTVARFEPSATLQESLASYIGALPLSLITPGRMGEFTRGMYFPYPSLQGLRTSSLVFVDKYTDLVAVLVWSILALSWYFGAIGVFGGIICLFFLIPLPSWIGKLRSSLEPANQNTNWVFKQLGRILKVVPPTENISIRQVLGLTLVGCIAFGMEWIQFKLLLEASNSNADFLTIAGVAAMITLCNSLQLTIAGLGVREGMAIALLGRLGISAENALFAAFSLFLLNLLIPACIGLAIKPANFYGAAKARVVVQGSDAL